MLGDKDRIFTNLYGYQPWTLAAARKRGDWDDTVLDALAAGKMPKAGTQLKGRHTVEPLGGPTTL
ncbi:MAG: hypothetical protein ABL893_19990, partial [Hyphomicrobium sp.]